MKSCPSLWIFVFSLFLASSIARASADFDVTSKYIDRDFSSLLKPKSEFLGYIGDDYQRLRITFTSIKQDKKDHTLYRVKGYSQVNTHRNDFEGVIVVNRISQLKELHYGVDDEFKDAKIQAEGIFRGEYDLREKPEESYSGKFTGTMTLNWYLDRNGNLRYDDIETSSDDFNNNQYVGVWTAYESKTKNKAANWGEYRIPFSGDLDIGAGDFGANPKYKDRGW